MDLSRKLGEMNFDGLIVGTNPKVQVDGKTIRKEGSAETTYKRGTIFAKSSIDGKLVILGTEAAAAVTGDGGAITTPAEELTADCILTDDVTVGTSADVVVTAYTAGCFNATKVIVADNYDITEADKDALRAYGIVLKAAFGVD